jgi:hypothetical protein
VKKQFDLMIGKMTSGSTAMAHQWSSDMNSYPKNAASAGKGVGKQFDSMIGKMASGSAALAHQWSSDMNSMIKNSAAANKGVMKQFNAMIGKASSGFDALAHQWSSDMNSMINNAKAAATGVNKELAKIKDVSVNVHVGASGPGLQYAQKGMHETLGEKELILVLTLLVLHLLVLVLVAASMRTKHFTFILSTQIGRQSEHIAEKWAKICLDLVQPNS